MEKYNEILHLKNFTGFYARVVNKLISAPMKTILIVAIIIPSMRTPIRIIDLARKIIEISGKDIDLEIKPAARPLTMSQTLNCSLARSTLSGWKPRVSLDNGLRKMYSHIEKRLEM